MQGLSIADVVNVTVNLTPIAASFRNFGALMIVGSSDVVDTTERIRQYSTLTAIASDFGTTAPEYLAAQLFFSQTPQPSLLYVGRWAQAATKARLNGATLSAAQQLIANFSSISTGSLAITIDGTVKTLASLNLSAQTNLNGVASVVQTALGGSITCVWNANLARFEIRSGTSGASSTITYASTTGSGIDISSLMGLQTGQASTPVAGIIAESALACATLMADQSSQWYGLTFATSTPPSTSDNLAIAAFIEGTNQSRIFGVTTQDANTLVSSSTTDLAYQLSALAYKRTFTQYSSSNPYAVASFFGRAFTVNFEASNTTLTMKFKQEPGIVGELLAESQAATLKTKHCNVFVKYDNSTAILQEGVMANGYFFDEVHGTDWLQNDVQTDLYNLLYTSTTKVPQTDDGTHLLVTTIENTLVRAVTNGLVAPGQWNAQGFGQLTQGDILTKGFYVYAPPISSQAQADREARKSVPILVAIKLAGAIHSTNVTINVNR